MLQCRHVCTLSVLVFLSSAGLSGQRQFQSNETEHFVSIYATGNYTTTSQGTFVDGRSVLQSDKAVLGAAEYFESWRRDNGLVVGGSYTRTESELMALNHVTTDRWDLQRYKFDALYERRFFTSRSLQPHLGVGGFLAVLWGGSAPAHSGVNASGWDSLVGVVIPAGVSARLNSRLSLTAGLLVDVGKASTYGDTRYRSSRNLMYEPQIGLSFRTGRAAGREW